MLVCRMGWLIKVKGFYPFCGDEGLLCFYSPPTEIKYLGGVWAMVIANAIADISDIRKKYLMKGNIIYDERKQTCLCSRKT